MTRHLRDMRKVQRRVALAGALMLGGGILGICASSFYFLASIHWAYAAGIFGGIFIVLGVFALALSDY